MIQDHKNKVQHDQAQDELAQRDDQPGSGADKQKPDGDAIAEVGDEVGGPA